MGGLKKICSICGNLERISKRDENGLPICRKCYNPLKPCSVCEKDGIITQRLDDGKAVCNKCYMRNYIVPLEKCSICQEINKVSVRNRDGSAVCSACYEPPKMKCSKCGKNKKVAKYSDLGPICHSCYKAPKHFCSKCGKLKPAQKLEDNKPVCQKCANYKHPKQECSCCGQIKPVHKWEDNNPICVSCYDRPLHKCSICGELKITAKKTDDFKFLCHNCYNRERYNNNEGLHILTLLRERVRRAFKDYSECGKIKHADEYGIDYQAIIQRLGSCPGDRKDYHIDHIIPLVAFDFGDLEQIKRAFAPENHQWLKSEENLSKNAKYDEAELVKFLKG